MGGLGGFGLCAYGAVRLISQGWLAVLMGAFGIVYLVSVYAGYHLWRNRTVGYRWSLGLQIFQIPAFSFTGLVYNFYIGGQLGVLFNNFDTRLLWGLGSQLNLNWSPTPVGGAFGINCLAVWAAWRLGRALWPTPYEESVPVATPEPPELTSLSTPDPAE